MQNPYKSEAVLKIQKVTKNAVKTTVALRFFHVLRKRFFPA